jgi:flagellar motor switch protein FliG
MAAIQLTEEQKVAILLASLDERVAANILQQLDPEVMTNVANAIRRLGVVPGEDRKKALAESLSNILAMTQSVQGDDRMVSSLLTRAVGEKRAVAILQDKTQTGAERFAGLRDASAEQIVAVIGNEQPSVIGVIVRYLAPEKAGEVMSRIPVEARKRVIAFLCKSNPPSADVVTGIERFVESRMAPTRKIQKVDVGNKVEVLAGILQHVDKNVEEEMLTAIEDSAEALANEVRDRLFTFEDIVKLSDVAVRKILTEVDTTMLAVAMRKASEQLKHKFFGNMSKRAAEGLREEMEFSQKMKLADILAKQREVVAVIRHLQTEGQITIGRGGEDELV